MKMNKQYAEEWIQRTSGEIFIANEAHFRHSDLFLKNYAEVKEAIVAALNGEVSEQNFNSPIIIPKSASPYYIKRIKAGPLNKVLKVDLKSPFTI